MNKKEIIALEEARYRKAMKERSFIENLSKSVGLPPRVADPTQKGYRGQTSCRRCGFDFTDNWWKYCPFCGQAIMHCDGAGAIGWKYDDAEKMFLVLMVREAEDELVQ